MDLVSVLPLAFVMVAGPQIISSFFLATGEGWKLHSLAYVLGAAISVTGMVSVGYLLAGSLGRGDGENSGVSWGIVALLAFAMVQTYRKRERCEPPRWMGKLRDATPHLAFVLGFLLLGFFPSDIVTSLSVGAHLANRGDPWWDALPFVTLTLFFLASPALGVALLGRRAEEVLPKIRDWMDANSWIVSEVVLLFFTFIVLSG